jgi:hypothetical protein
MEIPKRFKSLQLIANRHEKRVARFCDDASLEFNQRANELVRRIQKYVPEFRGCQLAMRRLYLYPMNLQIPITCIEDGEKGTERLGNLLDYLDDERYSIDINERAIEAFRELDAMADYIDDNYSMVSGMEAGDPTHC